jgi:hypothetical protein
MMFGRPAAGLGERIRLEFVSSVREEGLQDEKEALDSVVGIGRRMRRICARRRRGHLREAPLPPPLEAAGVRATLL